MDIKGDDHDVIHLSFKSIRDFGDLKHLMSNDLGDVVIDLGHGDTLTLDGATVKSFAAADFHF